MGAPARCWLVRRHRHRSASVQVRRSVLTRCCVVLFAGSSSFVWPTVWPGDRCRCEPSTATRAGRGPPPAEPARRIHAFVMTAELGGPRYTA